MSKYIGSGFDDFLEEEGGLVFQLKKLMKAQNLKGARGLAASAVCPCG